MVDWQVFKHRNKYLNWIYKAKMPSVKKWQIFHSSTDFGLTKMSFKSSKVNSGKMDTEGLKKKHGVTEEEQNITSTIIK